MTLNTATLASRISSESGLDFVGSGGKVPDGSQSYQLQPAHHPPARTFSLTVNVGWRSVDVSFRPGNFSGELLQMMGLADESGRAIFLSITDNIREKGAQVTFTINGNLRSIDDPTVWDTSWQSMTLSLQKGMLPINQGNVAADEDVIVTWVLLLSAAILALLPLEVNETAEHDNPMETAVGFPEGATVAVTANRYERDRRNRAAAIAIHGHVCKACATDMGLRYGKVATGLIEVHHTTLVSQLGSGYVVDPRNDLVPLCPNCHSVTHRRSPPYSVQELQEFLG